jgi:hypothetical protein
MTVQHDGKFASLGKVYEWMEIFKSGPTTFNEERSGRILAASCRKIKGQLICVSGTTEEGALMKLYLK